MKSCTFCAKTGILSTFPLMEKSAKDQADGKCHRTGSFAPTVGIALARSIRASF